MFHMGRKQKNMQITKNTNTLHAYLNVLSICFYKRPSYLDIKAAMTPLNCATFPEVRVRKQTFEGSV